MRYLERISWCNCGERPILSLHSPSLGALFCPGEGPIRNWIRSWVPLNVAYALTDPAWEEGPTIGKAQTDKDWLLGRALQQAGSLPRGAQGKTRFSQAGSWNTEVLSPRDHESLSFRNQPRFLGHDSPLKYRVDDAQ
jgi:hypothetical protein